MVCLRCRAHRLRPSFNMWFSSGKTEWGSSRYTAVIGIQCSINITHPLILYCCVCLHMLRATCTGSVWTIFIAFVLKSVHFLYLKTVICKHYAATVQHLSLRYFCNFDALWEVKKCLMQCGKVQYWSLDWMSAWLHSHEQRLP